MKKVITILFMLAVMASGASADTIDDSLGAKTSLQVRESTREMVKLGIPESEALTATKAMVQSRYQERQILQVHQSIQESRRAGLPAGPFMNKIREGIAKQVSAEQVVRAMEQVRTRYGHAYSRARGMVSEEGKVSSLGNAMAEGMAAGMAQGDVDSITQRLRTRTRTMDEVQLHKLSMESFMTARDMTRQGVKPATSTDVVCQALEKSWQYSDMEKLRSSFMTRARLEDPQGLALRYSNAIRNGVSSSQIDSAQAKGMYGQGARKGTGAQGGEQGMGQGGPGSGSGSGAGGGSSSGGSGGSSGSGSGAGGSGSGPGSGGGSSSGGSGSSSGSGSSGSGSSGSGGGSGSGAGGAGGGSSSGGSGK